MIGTILERAAGIAASLELDRVPEDTIAQAGFVIADTIAVSRAGSRQEECVRLLALSREDGMVGDQESGHSGAADGTALENRLRSATVFSSPGTRSSPQHAAFLNATAGSFLEMDEGMRPTGHPAMQLVPAAVSVAESRGASGAALLRAVLAGYELTSRLFRGFRLRYPTHPHGHVGAAGAALAVALLEDVDPIAAVRIASTTPVLSVWEACFEGATARNTWMGLAAQSGVRASQLAKAGFTGSARSLELAFGELVGELVDPEVLSADLSYGDLGIRHNYFKLHSACALNHAAIDATLRLELPDPERIERIVVDTVSNNMKVNRQAEANDLSARFSLPYAVATVAALGRTDPEAFRYRAEVATLAERVEVRTVGDLEAKWPEASPARVTAYWDGEFASAEVQNPHGHHSEPVTEAELKQKFLSLVEAPEFGEAWWERLTSLGEVESCAALFREEI